MRLQESFRFSGQRLPYFLHTSSHFRHHEMASGRQKTDKPLEQHVRCICCGVALATPHQEWQPFPDGSGWRSWETRGEGVSLTGRPLGSVPLRVPTTGWE